MDPNMERLAHNKLKGKIAAVLTALAEVADSGQFLGDRMLLTNVPAALSTEPDGMFISHRAVRSGRVRLERGEEAVEVEGSPDMVLEVISPSSVEKDTVVLRDLYWRAGVREYWLADPRERGVSGRNGEGGAVDLDILRRGPKGFVATRKYRGWVRSDVFGKSFRLTREADALGYPVYTLAVR